jgi:hypothetical protein
MNHAVLDSLSAAARQLLAGARAAGAYQHLVLQSEQTQWPEAMRVLEGLTAGTLFEAPVKRPDEASCALAGLWLYLDELDRAHRIVQEIGSPSGSFWHAIVHRREGDFSNSKYWYARCRDHPAAQALEMSGPALVDLVESTAHLPPDDARRARAVELQRREWELLFDYCARAAVGRAS